MTRQMDWRTKRRIERMPSDVLEDYQDAIATELDRARAKQQRLDHDLVCTKDAAMKGSKERRFARLTGQIEILEQIIDWVEECVA